MKSIQKIIKIVKHPEIFQIELTNHCNLDCLICPHRLITRKKGLMDFELLKIIVNRDLINKTIGIHILGESLLHPQATKFVKYLSDNDISVELATNATVLTPKLSKELIKAGLKRIWFSFDGGNKQAYEKIRQGANYEKVIKNIKDFLRINQKLGKSVYTIIQMVNYNKSKQEKQEFLKNWKGLGVNEIKIKFLDSWAGTFFNKQVKNPKGKRYPCKEPFERVAVLYNGNVIPCCRDWNGSYVYGNLYKNSLAKIWKGKKVRELRRQMIENDYKDLPCKTCKEWNIPMNRLIIKK
ncbi:MAG: radical SAM/SPASM domain-containing protein [bacterium]